MSSPSSSMTSYLPTSLTTTLQSLEETITAFLTEIFNSLPAAIQTYLITIADSPYLTRPNLQYALRLIVIISTYILFRPHLEALFRRATGAPDPRRTELENRLRFLQDLKDGKIQPQGGVEVVDGKVVVKPRPPPATPATPAAKKSAKGKGKVVKLVVPGDEGEVQGDSKALGEGQGQSQSQSQGSTATPNTRSSTRRRKA